MKPRVLTFYVTSAERSIVTAALAAMRARVRTESVAYHLEYVSLEYATGFRRPAPRPRSGGKRIRMRIRVYPDQLPVIHAAFDRARACT